MFRITLVVLSAILIQAVSFSTESKKDSLLKLLKVAKEDTAKVNTLLFLSSIYRTSDSDKAMDYANQSFNLAQTLSSKKHIAKTLNNIALLFRNKGKYDTAIYLYKKSLPIWEELKEPRGLASVSSGLGRIYELQGFYSLALKEYIKCLEYAEKANQKRDIAATLVNIGMIYYNQNQYETSLNYYNRALNLIDSAKNPIAVSNALNNIANIYNRKKDYTNSLHYNLRALKIRELAGNQLMLAASYANLGLIYYFKKDYTPAIKYQEMALKLGEEIKDNKTIIQALNNLGASLIETAKYPEADAYLLRSYDLAGKTKFREGWKIACGSLGDLYAITSPAKAPKYFREYIQINDTLFNETSAGQIAEMNVVYETAKKEQAIKEANALVTEERIIKRALIAGLGLILIVAVLIIRGYLQKKKANGLLAEKNSIIEEKNKDITDSINYAQKIQQALLPFEERISKAFKEFFILYKPKDIVSGDFYWFIEKNNKALIAAIDCTGHGVPGAFMSMIANGLLNDIVGNRGITDPGEILNELQVGVRKSLKQDETDSRDGMDISMLCWDLEKKEMLFAGANNDLWIVNSSKEFHLVKADSQGIGGLMHILEKPFSTKKIDVNEPLTFYLSTDGFADQFGGVDGKKFRKTKLKELIKEISDAPLSDQRQLLEHTFQSWKGKMEQVDDVCIIGIKVS